MTTTLKAAVKTVKKPPNSAVPYLRKAPDAIMAEVWRIKAQINADAGYSVANVLAHARSVAAAARAPS